MSVRSKSNKSLSLLVFEERRKPKYLEKNLLGARERSNKKLNQYMASTLESKPGPYWWEQVPISLRRSCPPPWSDYADSPSPPPPPPFPAALSSRMATLMGAKCLHLCTTLAPPDLIKQIAPHSPHCSLQSDGYIDGRRVLSPVCATLAAPDQIMQMTPHARPHCCSQ